jgi:GAF domain-containing protein
MLNFAAISLPNVINMDTTKKHARYERIYLQLIELLKKSNNPLSNMATIAALLSGKMDYFFWTGFYLLQDGKLQVGPYQGSLACIDLAKDTGVCWAGINQAKTVIVADVHAFEGHIACDSRSQSEIVIPLRNKTNEIIGVMDVDSSEKNSFDQTDAYWLERIVGLIYG